MGNAWIYVALGVCMVVMEALKRDITLHIKSRYMKVVNVIRRVLRATSHLEHWQDPAIVAINTVQPHTPLRLLDSKAEALGAVERKRGQGNWNIFLAHSDEPTSCAFKLFRNPSSVDLNNNNHAQWDTIRVPSNWQLEFPDRDPPIYTNITYPWKRSFLSTAVPRDDNPTGLYRIPFRIPPNWVDSVQRGHRELFLIFYGASSGIDVYVNGQHVGYGQDSMTETELNLSAAAATPSGLHFDADNILQCVVYKWTDGSYLEDQDQWWLSGIFRDIELQCRLKRGGLQDYVVKADASGLLTFEALLTGGGDNLGVEIELELYRRDSKQALQRRRESYRQLQGKSMTMQIDNCQLWNVQDPYLYTLLIGVYHDGQLVQVEATRVGFRTVAIRSSQLLVNEVALLVCGVNRHEFDAKLGKVMQEAQMLQDIRLMKQFNFNAVRCSHYPNVHRWYELCDEYGLFVVDEANIETHGFAGQGHISLLQNDDGWKHAFLRRCQAMVLRARNHACIIGWSLGNESGCGPNMRTCADWIRATDATRTVQYEGGTCSGDSPLIMGDGRDPHCTDILCPMYDSPLRCAEVVHESRDEKPAPRPFILCEYAHAMGNSSGNLHLYWHLFRSKKHPRLQGGFIWDWVDQGLSLPKPLHGFAIGDAYGYGGDFGDTSGKDDTTFCINGMVFPNRVPHPAMHEAKFLMQPLSFHRIDEAGGDDKLQLEVFGHCPSLDDLQFQCLIFDYKSAQPRESAPCTRELNSVMLKLPRRIVDDASAFTVIQASFNKDTPFAKANHIVATKVFQKNFQRLLVTEHDQDEKIQSPSIDDAGSDRNIIRITSTKYIAKFDMHQGRIMSLVDFQDGEPLLTDLKHSFSRAPTDNDVGGLDSMLPLGIFKKLVPSDDISLNAQWKNIGLDQLRASTMTVEQSGPKITVKQQHTHLNAVRFTTWTTYVFGHNGIQLTVKVEADDSTLKGAVSLPRVGLLFVLPSEFERVRYLGCGPHESYADRKASSILGVHETTVSDMHVPYIWPCENGGRADVQWVQFESSKRKNKNIEIQYCIPRTETVGVEFFDGDDLSRKEPNASRRPSDMKGAQFSASRYSVNDLTKAKHQSELPAVDVEQSPIYVHIDTAQQGLGGDVSWRPKLHRQYKVHDKSWMYTVVFTIGGRNRTLMVEE